MGRKTVDVSPLFFLSVKNLYNRIFHYDANRHQFKSKEFYFLSNIWNALRLRQSGTSPAKAGQACFTWQVNQVKNFLRVWSWLRMNAGGVA